MPVFVSTIVELLRTAALFVHAVLQSRSAIAAENTFLRRQLALYVERGIKPRRADRAARFVLVQLSRYLDWRSALVVVSPRTFISWHRAGWRLLWRYRSRPGRPRIPIEVRELIRRMAKENVLWGEERIANELFLKLGIKLSPRTVRKYMPKRPRGTPRGDQRWRTFLRNHAKGIIACDFLLSVTIAFRSLYVFVIIEHATRRLLHFNVTAKPSADWTLQQFREVVGEETRYEYLLHDRDTIFSKGLDQSMTRLGLTTLRSPRDSPKANAICERVIGSMRRECLDWMIPISGNHLRAVLREWVAHYNSARPHMALGPGIPSAISTALTRAKQNMGAIDIRAVLGGLHHEYSWARA